ncbi:MAG: prephenate dehydrogenase [Eubacteriales bacterium]|nr:prephenate dehydrogenase [Clostridiales bacterium]MDY3286536.1 prephenate dehydrogenase [Eubacteriales bacterium]MDY5016382.1 prephenate dehydrogenase [Eubacteriales bacterium]
MNIGIAGLGLIGGSLAKSAHKNTAHRIFGFDRAKTVLDYALLSGFVDETLDDRTIPSCDCIFLALYPGDVVRYVQEHAAQFAPDALVIDCAGVKRSVCEPCFALAAEHGFHFIGGHPMAGSQYSGIKHARDTLYSNATFVFTPRPGEDVAVLSRADNLVREIGFARISVMTPEKHDRLIAFTSQLAHIVSNAYVKSPSANEHRGISAGSYKDLTRVAYLNEEMWTELFLDNRDNLLFELDTIIASLQQYADAMRANDPAALKELLREGREAKERIDL